MNIKFYIVSNNTMNASAILGRNETVKEVGDIWNEILCIDYNPDINVRIVNCVS